MISATSAEDVEEDLEEMAERWDQCNKYITTWRWRLRRAWAAMNNRDVRCPICGVQFHLTRHGTIDVSKEAKEEWFEFYKKSCR